MPPVNCALKVANGSEAAAAAVMASAAAAGAAVAAAAIVPHAAPAVGKGGINASDGAVADDHDDATGTRVGVAGAGRPGTATTSSVQKGWLTLKGELMRQRIRRR